MIAALVVLLVVAALLFYVGFRKKAHRAQTVKGLADNYRSQLVHIPFYVALSSQEKLLFESEVNEFLHKVNIVGIDTVIDDYDRVLIASGAVMPLFAFPDWFYPNLSVVEVYSDAFNENFNTQGEDRRILGMVGTGAMNGRLSISKAALHRGFRNDTDKRNTVVHEFVHLMDMADGAVDGSPEILMTRQEVLPWLNYIRAEIERIRYGKSDIDKYGGTSETEFFAVASEYFFERPELLQQKHPHLFELMSKAFRRVPEVAKAASHETPGRNDDCFCGSGKKFKNCHGAA